MEIDESAARLRPIDFSFLSGVFFISRWFANIGVDQLRGTCATCLSQWSTCRPHYKRAQKWSVEGRNECQSGLCLELTARLVLPSLKRSRFGLSNRVTWCFYFGSTKLKSHPVMHMIGTMGNKRNVKCLCHYWHSNEWLA